LSERPHLAGACLRSIPVCDNHYAQIDARTFEEGYRVFRQDGDWRKVNVHGFALRKTVYEAVGGLACRYGRFAEMMLAAELRDRGHRLGYAEDAAVLHHYRSTLAELVEGIDEYIRGESIYRAEHPGPDRIGYSFLPDSDNPFASEHKAMRWAVCRTLGFDWLFRGGCLRKAIGRAFWPALANGLAASLFGSRWHTGSAALLTKLAMGRCWWRRDNAHKLDAAYRDLIVQATRLSRWRFLAEQPAESNGLPPARSRYSILEIPEGHSLGLHNVEWSDGRPFRWTGRCAAFRLHADEAPRAVHIDTMNLRHFPMPLNLSAFLNGSALTVSDLPNGMIRLDVSQPARPAAGEQILVLACNPFSPWSVGVCDQRELGLPIASLELVAAEVSTPMPIRAAA
jgi:hypothetical protein